MSTPTMPTTKVLPPSRADREADADLLVDIPQLSADELALEVESTPELSRVKVDAKGLQSGVFVRADLEPVLRIMHERSQRQGGGRPGRRRGGALDRVRSRLREILGGARGQEPERAERHPQDGNGTRPHVGRHSAAQGAVAAGLTAAGLAGGALLEARVKPTRKLPIPRRRTRGQVIREELTKRLP